jgi:hypothetical protein
VVVAAVVATPQLFCCCTIFVVPPVETELPVLLFLLADRGELGAPPRRPAALTTMGDRRPLSDDDDKES